MMRYPGISNPPKSTHFKYPNGRERRGTVVSEIYMPKLRGEGGDYLFIIQTISYEKEPGKPYIRFGYYRKEHRTNDGGQVLNYQFSSPPASRAVGERMCIRGRIELPLRPRARGEIKFCIMARSVIIMEILRD